MLPIIIGEIQQIGEEDLSMKRIDRGVIHLWKKRSQIKVESTIGIDIEERVRSNPILVNDKGIYLNVDHLEGRMAKILKWVKSMMKIKSNTKMHHYKDLSLWYGKISSKAHTMPYGELSTERFKVKIWGMSL